MRVQLLCCFLLVLNLVGVALSNVCPFDYLYHFGDGVTDIGNSVLVQRSIPPSYDPYGKTFPGAPNGRWSDGLIDFDFAAADFGFPGIVPYLSENSSSNNGVIFSVARSPVLGRSFLKSRGIRIPPYAVPLKTQIKWFKSHLETICSSKKACAEILGKALILLGDIEGNDIGYALTQGKSIEEVKTYVPFIVKTQMKIARDLINMGLKRLILPGNSAIGCYPYMLTALAKNESAAYDSLGCLKDVNDFIVWKNNELQQAITNLAIEFPDITIYYGSMYDGFMQILQEISASDPNGDITLKSCCGIGGKYNYDSKRFCSEPGVPVCPNPDQYMFWDGLHLTHTAQLRIEQILIVGGLASLNCTTTQTMQLTASM